LRSSYAEETLLQDCRPAAGDPLARTSSVVLGIRPNRKAPKTMRSRVLTAALSLTALAAAPGASQNVPADQRTAPGRAEVLVVGVYHMANPAGDVFNMEADDVLSPGRQAEIAEVVAVFRRFQPTRIAVEASFSDRRTAARYADYVAGTYELTRNEIDQLGFRLARELGHRTVYAVDVGGEFPFPRLVKYAQATGRSSQFDSLQAEIGSIVAAQTAYLASHTVLETLLEMNSDDQVAAGVGYYFRYADFGEPWDWAGADLVSDWFRRNMRIYSNITGLIESPAERVLVIYGAGHLGWLQYAFDNNPEVRLRKLADFVQ
jgi:hypothetical protein